MSDNTNTTDETPAQTNLLDERIKDAREDVAKAQAKLDKLLTEAANRDRIAGLDKGTEVSFEYGRGEKRRTLTGTIIASDTDPKLGRVFAVQTGTGVDIQTLKIRAADVLFDAGSETDDMTDVVS